MTKQDRIHRLKWKIWHSGQSIKQVCERAGLNHNSVYAQMNGAGISDKRLTRIEKAI